MPKSHIASPAKGAPVHSSTRVTVLLAFFTIALSPQELKDDVSGARFKQCVTRCRMALANVSANPSRAQRAKGRSSLNDALRDLQRLYGDLPEAWRKKHTTPAIVDDLIRSMGRTDLGGYYELLDLLQEPLQRFVTIDVSRFAEDARREEEPSVPSPAASEQRPTRSGRTYSPDELPRSGNLFGNRTATAALA
jgi:hypothetical protein